MSQQELLKKLVEALERAGIDYMITGSIASSLQGEPRATHDIDLVVLMDQAAVPALLAAFPRPEFYLEEAAVRAAIQERGMFNAVEASEGTKIDFWLHTDTPFDRSRFSRKYAERVFDMEIQVSSPEDTIVAKLQWTKLSGDGEKYFQDALRVYEVQAGSLDVGYIERWVEQLSVATLWQRLRDEAEEL